MHDNSLQAYEEENLKLGAKALQVYRFLKHNRYNSYTVSQLSRMMGFAHRSEIQPRVSDLIKKGLVREAGNVKCDETGKTVALIKFNNQEDQLEMF